MQKENKVIVKLNCFPGEFLSGVSRFFVSDGKISVRSKIGRCRITTLRQNTDFNVGLTPDLYANLRCSPYRSGVNPTSNKGFTLIELLVVVLIIGILSAVALPQYQKAVEKSRATQALTLLKSIYQAADAYYLANGVWPTRFDELGIDVTLGESTSHTRGENRTNNDWTVGVFNNGIDHGGSGVYARRKTGKYKGGGFFILKETNDFDKDVLICAETFSGGGNYYMATGDAGNYCVKLFKGTKVGGSTASQIYYSMP